MGFRGFWEGLEEIRGMYIGFRCFCGCWSGFSRGFEWFCMVYMGLEGGFTRVFMDSEWV